MVFSTLALLYPDFDLTQHFQVDHVFPKGFFKPSNLNIKTKKKIAKNLPIEKTASPIFNFYLQARI